MPSVAVFCSASASSLIDEFIEPASRLARSLVLAGFDIVYGGSDCGLMGVVANAALEEGGNVYGVIPKLFDDHEIQHPQLTELMVVENMHQRKKKMFDMADAIVILPGGLGTLDELVEALTWKQLKIHETPVYLLRVGEFWNHILSHVEFLKNKDLLHGADRLFEVSEDVPSLIENLKAGHDR